MFKNIIHLSSSCLQKIQIFCCEVKGIHYIDIFSKFQLYPKIAFQKIIWAQTIFTDLSSSIFRLFSQQHYQIRNFSSRCLSFVQNQCLLAKLPVYIQIQNQQFQFITNKMIAQQIRKNRNNIRQNLKKTSSNWTLSLRHNLRPQSESCEKISEQVIEGGSFYNQYKLLNKIGQGAHAIVYRCEHLASKAIYAVKIVRGDEEILRTSKRTYQIMKFLNHRNIIKGKALFIDEVSEKFYLIMQYCNYKSLFELKTTLSSNQKNQIIRDILATTSYMHKKGICHRDLKMENILYDPIQKEIKIIDFGISKFFYCNTKTLRQPMWTSTGTLHYMAPQMFLGGQYQQTIDQWAIGVITYQLFYGKLPFDSEYKSDTINMIINSEPKYEQNSESILLNDFIKGLLKKKPENRLTVSQAQRHPWIEGIYERNRLVSQNEIDIEILQNIQYRVRGLSLGGQQSQALWVAQNKEQILQKIKNENSIFEIKKKY